MKLVTILAVTVAALGAATALPGASSERADYGDAPDGRPTGYGPRGEFPSLLKNDGARAANTSFAFLGKDVTRELDSLQVDQDRRDDGVFVRLVPCQMSEALVLVTLPKPGVGGAAFLNLFFDWNRDGRWEGADWRCSGAAPPEWVVRNAPVNLPGQNAREQLYRVRFRAGSFVGSMWFRAVLSVGERLRDERGTGAVARGEVEDFIYAQEADATLQCFAGPIQHGTSASVTVAPVVGGTNVRILSARLLLTEPATPERVITRDAAIAANGKSATFKYTSLKKDKRKIPVVVDTLKIVVRAKIDGRTRNIVLQCPVLVQHEPETTFGGGPPPAGSGGVGRLGWYSGPTEKFGSIDLFVAKAGGGKAVRKLQFTSRITCTKGVTSQHVHVDGSFPIRVAGGRETFTGRSTSFDVGQPIGRPPGSFTVTGTFTDPGGSMSNGTLRLTYTHQDLGTCDTGTVTWQAPAAARPTHAHQ